jgi:hypothetical protein
MKQANYPIQLVKLSWQFTRLANPARHSEIKKPWSIWVLNMPGKEEISIKPGRGFSKRQGRNPLLW